MKKEHMKKKINILELLKDCPSGMELDCAIIENVYFDKVLNDSIKCYYIKNRTKTRGTIYFNNFGECFSIENAKCVIFPKGKTTWEGFVPPCKFEDGDILAEDSCIFIIQKLCDNTAAKTYCTLYDDGTFDNGTILHFDIDSTKPATEEEKVKLFQAIKDNGYKWNEETKTLEKLPKFKDGDVIANNTYIVIFHKVDKIPNGVRNDVVYYHCWYRKNNNNSKFKIDFGIGYASDFRFATDEEKQILFESIEEHGYKWNPESKTLEKLIKPKFNVGDRIVDKLGLHSPTLIKSVSDEYYGLELPNAIGVMPVKDQDDWELVPNKFDITTLKPFDKVLVRDNNTQKWTADLFSFFDKNGLWQYSCVGHYTKQCIPYEGNEHLLGTTNDCNDFYKTWEE